MPCMAVRLVPGLVDVDGEHHVVAEAAPDRLHVRDVLGQRAAADLQLEDVVAARLDQFPGLVDVARGIAAGEGPQHRQRSRMAPPSSAWTGRPRRWPCASSKAVSTADLANELPCTAPEPTRCIAALTLVASLPISSGAR